MSASGRFKRWLVSKLNRKQTEPEIPASDVPTRLVKRLKPLEVEEPEDPATEAQESPLSYTTHHVSKDVVQVVYETRTFVRPKRSSTTKRCKKDHILRKDPITRKIKRIDLKDIDESPSRVIFYDDRGRLIE